MPRKNKEDNKEYNRKKYLARTPEQKALFNEYNRLKSLKYYREMSPEKKEKVKEYQRNYYANMSEEKKREYRFKSSQESFWQRFLNN